MFGPAHFINLALGLTNAKHSIDNRGFRALFGITPYICSMLWAKCIGQLSNGAEPKHLLWTLTFLKVYSTESVHCVLFGTTEKTFQKWVCCFIGIISDLSIASNYCINCTNIHFYSLFYYIY